MAYLIEHNGERMIVSSLKGHEGDKIIKRGLRKAPSPHHRWDGRWTKDEAGAERDRLNRMSNAELVEEIMRRLGK